MIPIGNKIATLDGFVDLKEVLDVYHKAKDLEKENNELKDLLYRLQTFFGIDRELLYRDLDGELYPLDISEINKILENR